MVSYAFENLNFRVFNSDYLHAYFDLHDGNFYNLWKLLHPRRAQTFQGRVGRSTSISHSKHDSQYIISHRGFWRSYSRECNQNGSTNEDCLQERHCKAARPSAFRMGERNLASLLHRRRATGITRKITQFICAVGKLPRIKTRLRARSVYIRACALIWKQRCMCNVWGS